MCSTTLTAGNSRSKVCIQTSPAVPSRRPGSPDVPLCMLSTRLPVRGSSLKFLLRPLTIGDVNSQCFYASLCVCCLDVSALGCSFFFRCSLWRFPTSLSRREELKAIKRRLPPENCSVISITNLAEIFLFPLNLLLCEGGRDEIMMWRKKMPSQCLCVFVCAFLSD